MTRTAAEDQQAWNRYWTRWAAEYDEHQLSRLSLPGEREAWSRAFGVSLPAGTREVLDLGTGSGNVALLLAADGYDVTGIDLSPCMLAQARAKLAGHPHPPTFLEADAANPPFAQASLDAIVSRYLLWTLRDAPTALRRWHELLRPGGVLVAVDGQWFEPEDDGSAAPATPRQAHFAEAYDEEAVDQLAFARAGVERICAAWEEAGFVEVRADPLPELLELDRVHGVAPGHSPQLLHRFSARRGD
ncbi:MAG TPA: class I SAM-dependent methyltransferase [Brachybacterium paraconglomeratum]|uniref:Class I SAM-dependent methyltransferase n=1 Tax=Brachybacterium paraconglomeratum TaxID=173362 RepID=A0A921KS08_9MICO|nr:class I SAM-dependent methyltransferase [Brachybacterium paraconglomeratum]